MVHRSSNFSPLVLSCAIIMRLDSYWCPRQVQITFLSTFHNFTTTRVHRHMPAASMSRHTKTTFLATVTMECTVSPVVLQIFKTSVPVLHTSPGRTSVVVYGDPTIPDGLTSTALHVRTGRMLVSIPWQSHHLCLDVGRL